MSHFLPSLRMLFCESTVFLTQYEKIAPSLLRPLRCSRSGLQVFPHASHPFCFSSPGVFVLEAKVWLNEISPAAGVAEIVWLQAFGKR